jgi:hypothetical protein
VANIGKWGKTDALVLHLARFMAFRVSRVRPEKAINFAPNGTRFVKKITLDTNTAGDEQIIIFARQVLGCGAGQYLCDRKLLTPALMRLA